MVAVHWSAKRTLPAALMVVVLAPWSHAGTKQLIEMGWDEPDPAFMRLHLSQLEASPFDGCVYHLPYRPGTAEKSGFSWEAFGPRTFQEGELTPALNDLQATPFRRFRSCFLRMNVTPGSIDWFDDFSSILSNARLGASIARRGGSAGILLDTEEYERHLFDYTAQRDTAGRTYYEYAQQARRRGAELMRAFEAGYPGLVVFLTYSATLPYIQWRGDRIRPERGRYGLLAPFVDGMIGAASDSARIVDGMEAAYPVRDPAQLDLYLHFETDGVLPWLSDSTRYRAIVSRSFGVWMDFDWGKRGWNTVVADANYRSPAALKAVLHRALQLADHYVWLYSEQPRWWTAQGGTAALPKPFVQAVRDARQGIDP